MEFLVETYLSRTEPVGGVPLAEHVSRVAETVAREGREVSLVRAIAVTEEETCFYLFRAASAETVLEAASRAGLQVDRVVEAVSEPWTHDPAAQISWTSPSELPNQPKHQGEQQ